MHLEHFNIFMQAAFWKFKRGVLQYIFSVVCSSNNCTSGPCALCVCQFCNMFCSVRVIAAQCLVVWSAESSGRHCTTGRILVGRIVYVCILASQRRMLRNLDVGKFSVIYSGKFILVYHYVLSVWHAQRFGDVKGEKE